MFIRRSKERGYADHGWLKSFHTFSFANYYDPKFVNFSDLRVINQDQVMPGGGFGTHPHHNMEIISFVISGELAHKDTLGNQAVIRPGEIQVMSAGTGIEHSEFNHDPQKPVHFYQIWIVPNQLGGAPYYQQKSYLDKLSDSEWCHLVSSSDRDGLVKIRQNASLYLAQPKSASRFELAAQPNKSYWLQLIEGEVEINSHRIFPGDGVAWSSADDHVDHIEWLDGGGAALLFELN